MSENRTLTAAMLVIGDEILSGQTKDKNIGFVADTMRDIGIDLEEVRIVGDREEVIIDALDALRNRYDFVFTSGGIGPTHDDITADCVAKAFGVPIGHDPRAVALLEAHWAKRGIEPNESRLRMARIPQGAELIANSVSVAPGFHIGNVFVMAGVPNIMQAMMDEVVKALPAGALIRSETVIVHRPEGDLAGAAARIQAEHPKVRIGSYPSHDGERFTTRLVLRSRDEPALAAAKAAMEEAVANV